MDVDLAQLGHTQVNGRNCSFELTTSQHDCDACYSYTSRTLQNELHLRDI
jgi:hypothetical protein